jgi:hypothetical protein
VLEHFGAQDLLEAPVAKRQGSRVGTGQPYGFAEYAARRPYDSLVAIDPDERRGPERVQPAQCEAAPAAEIEHALTRPRREPAERGANAAAIRRIRFAGQERVDR